MIERKRLRHTTDWTGELHARVRLCDVARMAGVSEPTASRSLRDDPQISTRTRALVRQVAERAGYVPNATARNLAQRRSQTFGLMVPDVTDPVHGQIVSAFENAVTGVDYSLLVSSFRYDTDLEDRALRTLVSNQAEGIAIFGGVLEPEDVRARWRDANLVFIGPENLSSLDHEPTAGTLVVDDAAGVKDAVGAAIGLGYRKLAYLSGPQVASNSRRRAAAASALVAIDAGALPVYEVSVDGYAGLAGRIVNDNRDLVLCFDDQCALRLLSAFHALHVRVPGDIGVIGFDDIPFAVLSNPPLSTVAVPYVELAEVACRMLMEQMSSGAASAPVRFGAKLMLRATTAARTSST